MEAQESNSSRNRLPIPEFTFLQKIAMMRLLQELMRADGRASNREMMYYLQLMEQFRLAQKFQWHINRTSALIALSRVKAMDESQKEFFSQLVAKMLGLSASTENKDYLRAILKEYAGIDSYEKKEEERPQNIVEQQEAPRQDDPVEPINPIGCFVDPPFFGEGDLPF